MKPTERKDEVMLVFINESEIPDEFVGDAYIMESGEPVLYEISNTEEADSE